MSGKHAAPREITLHLSQPTFPRIFITTSLRNLPAATTCLFNRPCGLLLARRVKDAIHQLKYRNQVNLAEPLGKPLGKSLEVAEVGFKPDCIIPVPLHPGRLKKRGYNQALEISRPLARKMQVPIDTTLLQRTLTTPPQQGLTAAERRSNLRNAFIVTTTTSARNILLVDDVMTTGETVRECCRVLMKTRLLKFRLP